MAVVIERDVWDPNPWLYIFLFSAALSSILLHCHSSKKHSSLVAKAPTAFENGVSSFLRFQRSFLLIYNLVSVLEALGSAFGEFSYAGLMKNEMLFALCVGQATSLVCGAFAGVFFDIIGQKKACLTFCILHVFIGLWKKIASPPSVLVSSTLYSLSSSIFVFSFETWMVTQHDKQGRRQDTLNEMLWLMSFFESVAVFEGQVLSNWLIGDDVERKTSTPSFAAAVVGIVGIVYIIKGWSEVSQKVTAEEYKMSFSANVLGDKRMWLLAWAQACLHFSTNVFSILWAPTLVADGREMNLGLIYACLIGSRMLGSTIFPWLTGGLSSFRTEEYMVYAFSILGCVLSIIAYDYQEVGILFTLFCIFHASVGLILPSLAKLRTTYVPNQLRGGFISLSHAPANAAILFFLVQGGYYRNISNATFLAISAIGVFTAAFCMYMLKRLGKQPYHNGCKL